MITAFRWINNPIFTIHSPPYPPSILQSIICYIYYLCTCLHANVAFNGKTMSINQLLFKRKIYILMSDLSIFIMQIYKISTISRKNLNANIYCEGGTKKNFFLWQNFCRICVIRWLLGGKFGEFGKFWSLERYFCRCFMLYASPAKNIYMLHRWRIYRC